MGPQGRFCASSFAAGGVCCPLTLPCPRPFLQSCPRGEGRGGVPTGAGRAMISALHAAGAREAEAAEPSSAQFLSESPSRL